MRLIDADAMCADLATVDPRYDTIVEWCIRVTEAQPTVDAVEVVRCKDCKHHDPEDRKCDCGALERAGCVFPVADDYFCSWGERREDGKTD